MRNAFIQALEKVTAKNKNLLVLSGDLGYTVFESFIEKYPQQFFNFGVGEANLMGMAAGLAKEGKIPVCYSIIPFITLRCYEQIRNDVCSHKANVKIVGVGSGLGYAHLGISHHAGEDVAIMRALPNMSVLVPADPQEVKGAINWALFHKGPVYVRLGKVGEPSIHRQRLVMNKNTGGFVLRRGGKVLIFTAGTIAHNVLGAVTLLEKQGITAHVVSVPFVKPLAKKWISELARKYRYIYVVEEHSIIGGLGSAIAETLLEAGVAPPYFKRIGFNDSFCHTIGSYEYMRAHMGLSPEKIADEVLKTLRKQKYPKIN